MLAAARDPSPCATGERADNRAEDDVVGDLRPERQPADGRVPPSDHPEVEGCDRDARGCAPRGAAARRERPPEHRRPEE
jgi:hypothetical protein